MNLNTPIKLNAGLLRMGAAVLVVLFAAYVWPTPYRYVELSRRQRYLLSTFVVRINRFTGRADVLDPHQGWVCYGNCPSGANQRH